MLIIIDGYNVLRGILLGRHASQKDRTNFLAQLTKYARIKKHALTVVFDGGQSAWPEKEDHKSLTVVYSGFNDSADDYIKTLLHENKGKQALLVSSDREINWWASKLEIPSIDAQEFYELVELALLIKAKKPAAETPLIKTAEREHVDIDMLMHEATQEIPIKKEDVAGGPFGKKKGVAKRRSKKDRILLEILKKL